MKKNKRKLLEETMRLCEESAVMRSIVIEALPESVGYGFLDDVYDADRDSIIARAVTRFQIDGVGLVQVYFQQGSAPRWVANVLRKMADMLAGPDGMDLANMENSPGRFDFARRFEDGEVGICNLKENIERYRREREMEDPGTHPDGDG